MLQIMADPKIESILVTRDRDRASLVPLLQDIQAALGYLPEHALRRVAVHLRMSPAAVYGVVTSYAQFRLTQRGENLVRVCRGTACHVRGGAGIRKAVEETLGVGPGETTPDMKFTYETIACIGACGLAPVMAIEGATYGEMTPERARALIESVSGDGG